jgi:hypothetical protein
MMKSPPQRAAGGNARGKALPERADFIAIGHFCFGLVRHLSI